MVPAMAQETTDTTTATEDGGAADAAQDGLLAAGFEAYTATCSGCHQAGGIGIEGTFPPLVGNPNVMDEEYLRTTIANGKQGELVVNGVTYNGVMPAFDSLADEDVDAIVAYVQSGFQVPASSGAAGEDAIPVVTGSLPDLSGMAIFAALALAGVVALFILGPRIVAVQDRLTMPWFDAWLRVAIIVVFFVVALAFIPSMIMQTETVAKLPRAVQDVIGLTLWGGGLVVGLWALWYTHKEDRI
jgi:mono/diheme cytochrome c family protein